VVVDDEEAEKDLGLGWFSTPAEAADNVDTDADLEARRQALMDQATELGLQVHHRSGIDKIQAALDEHAATQELIAAQAKATEEPATEEPTTPQE